MAKHKAASHQLDPLRTFRIGDKIEGHTGKDPLRKMHKCVVSDGDYFEGDELDLDTVFLPRVVNPQT